MIGVAVLGSTGSVGESTLDVLARHPERFRLIAIAANSNAAKLARQIRTWRPAYAALADEHAAAELRALLDGAAHGTRVLAGSGALEELALLPEVHCVMAAIVGAAGLRSTLAAARAGKRLLLANKESLVMAGPLLISAVNASGATLLPIDSEHNAIFQCLPAGAISGVAPPGLTRVLLTASGGPFRDTPAEALAEVTPEAACAHPNWVMGRKISVDSATLMNKGLDLLESGRLDFRPPDIDKFRCLALAQAAACAGGLSPVVLNAANEVAVAAFLERRLNFPAIPAVIEAVMERASGGAIGGLEDVLAADADGRMHARERIVRLTAGARGAHA